MMDMHCADPPNTLRSLRDCCKSALAWEFGCEFGTTAFLCPSQTVQHVFSWLGCSYSVAASCYCKLINAAQEHYIYRQPPLAAVICNVSKTGNSGFSNCKYRQRASVL